LLNQQPSPHTPSSFCDLLKCPRCSPPLVATKSSVLVRIRMPPSCGCLSLLQQRFETTPGRITTSASVQKRLELTSPVSSPSDLSRQLCGRLRAINPGIKHPKYPEVQRTRPPHHPERKTKRPEMRCCKRRRVSMWMRTNELRLRHEPRLSQHETRAATTAPPAVAQD
jgi:hypothetical protein